MSKYKYSSDWITELENYNRWNLYWQQQKLIHNRLKHSDLIAEIGVGTKFTYNYLKSKSFNITSIDIDQEKNPDIILNIVECEPSELKYEVIMAFNIFEHIPYPEFIDTIGKFSNAGVKKVFFSVPVNRKTIFEFRLKLGRYFEKEFNINIKRKKITAEHHHWELDFKEYTKEKIVSDFAEKDYSLKDLFFFRNQSYFYFERKSEM